MIFHTDLSLINNFSLLLWYGRLNILPSHSVYLIKKNNDLCSQVIHFVFVDSHIIIVMLLYKYFNTTFILIT